jgi:dipeptidyl aminopeptidase/acylaminoacyl peptidase
MRTEVKTENLFKTEYKPDLEAYLNISSSNNPIISPDGQTVYFTSSLTEKPQLMKITEDNNFPIQVTFRKDGIKSPSMSPDGKWIIFLDDKDGDEYFQMYLFELKSGRYEALTNEPENIYDEVLWASDSETIYFSARMKGAENNAVYSMDLATRKVRTIFKNPGYCMPSNISNDGRYLLILEMIELFDINIHLMDLVTEKSSNLTLKEKKARNLPVTLSSDNNVLYYITNDTPQGVLKLSAMDVNTRESRVIFDADSLWDMDFAIPNNNNDVIAMFINEEGYTLLKLLDLNTMKKLSSPDIKGVSYFASFSSGSKIAFSYESSAKPCEIYTWDWKTCQLTQKTFTSFAGIEPGELVEPKLIRYKSFDGLEIPAFLYLPENCGNNAEKIPFIINFHGGPASQAKPYFNAIQSFYLANGFGYMTPNVRGSTGYGKEFAALDDYKKRMDSVKDGYYAAKYLIDEGYTEKGKIGVSGHSYGGFMVMAVITEYPDMWSASHQTAGFVDFVNMMKNSNLASSLREREYGPTSDEEFLKSISPIHKLDRIKTPLMVCHGKNDFRVPVSEAYQIIENLESRGVPLKSIILEDEGHGINKTENRIRVFTEVVEFFKEHLK